MVVLLPLQFSMAKSAAMLRNRGEASATDCCVNKARCDCATTRTIQQKQQQQQQQQHHHL
jgi:hypothetical protein